MRIAIVGAGVSGLVAAHLLHGRHEIVVYEAGGYAGGHTNTIRVDTEYETHHIDTGFIVMNDRNYPLFTRLLDRLGVARQRTQMSFSVKGESEDFEYSGTPHGLFCQPRNLVSLRFQRMILDLLRFNRELRLLLEGGATGQADSLADFLVRHRFSRQFVERLIVPQASAVWSADPAQMHSFPVRFLAEFFANHGMLGFRDRPHWSTIEGGSARYVEALTAPFGDRIRLGAPVRSIAREPGHVTVVADGRGGRDSQRFDQVVIAAHSDQALRVLVGRLRARAPRARRDPLSAQRGRAPHRPAPASAAALGALGLELPPAGRAEAGLDGHLLDEPPAAAARRPRLLRHAQPHRGDRPRAGDPHDLLLASGVHPGRCRRPVPARGDQRHRAPHALLRRLLGLGVPRGRRAQRAGGLRTVRGDAVRSALYEGSVRHRRLAGDVRDEFRHPLFMAYLDLDELPGALDGGLLCSARRPALAWFRRADHLGDERCDLAESVRELVAERTGRRPGGPIALLTHLRCFGHNFNPVSFYWCYGRDSGRVEAVVAHVTNTPWGESHAYVLDAEDRRPAVAADGTERVGAAADAGTERRPTHPSSLARGTFDKELHVSPLMGMEQTYDLFVTEPGERISVHIASSDPRGRTVFDATLSLARRELTRRTLASLLARYPLQTVAILTRIYGHALRLRLRGATYHPHPEREKAAA